jgi:NitT/TauT family transport system ATP-binding protein
MEENKVTTRAVPVAETPTLPTAISYEHVSVAYDDGRGNTTVAIDDVSFEIPKGSFTSIIGPSGCGKTTLLRLCAGFQVATTGQTRCNGDVVRELNHEVGYVTQHSNLYPWMTIRENVEFALQVRSVPKEERRRRSSLYLQKMGLAEFADTFPYQLSGGMQKRACIAQTLIYEPDIIMMDESFAGLDSQTRMDVEADLMRLWQDLRPTIVFVTHDLSEAISLSDHVVVMSARPGRVKTIYDVPLPRPRNIYEIQGDPRFATAYSELWEAFGAESAPGSPSLPGPAIADPAGASAADSAVRQPGSQAKEYRAAPPAGVRRPGLLARALSGHQARVHITQVLLLLCVLGLWELLSDTNVIDPLVFSHPVGVVRQLVDMLAGQQVQQMNIYTQIWTTLEEMIIGFAVGSAAGVVLGVGLARNRFLADTVQPFILASFGVPVIAIAPIVILILGIGFDSKAGTAAVTTFFVVFFQTFGGVSALDEDKFLLGRLMGGSSLQLARRVLVPASLPSIFQGLRMGVPLAMTGAVIGEFIASTQGLGAFILRTSSSFDAAALFAALIILLIVVAVCAGVIALVERRVLRWLPGKAR